MTVYQWVTLGLGAFGFLSTWILGAFKIGRAVEQMRSGVREEIKQERDSIISKIEDLERRFEADQKTQDHNFGEVARPCGNTSPMSKRRFAKSRYTGVITTSRKANSRRLRTRSALISEKWPQTSSLTSATASTT
jgi:hypothetical protein